MKKYALIIMLAIVIPSIGFASWKAFGPFHKNEAPNQQPTQKAEEPSKAQTEQVAASEVQPVKKIGVPKEKPVSAKTNIVEIPQEWINPAGGFYTPEEVAKNLAMKNGAQICKQRYGIHSLLSSQKDASGNLLCTCESGYEVRSNSCQIKQQSAYDNGDPYGVLYGTGNAYTADQLNAIECAYYGRSCPTVHIILDN